MVYFLLFFISVRFPPPFHPHPSHFLFLPSPPAQLCDRVKDVQDWLDDFPRKTGTDVTDDMVLRGTNCEITVADLQALLARALAHGELAKYGQRITSYVNARGQLLAYGASRRVASRRVAWL